MIILVGKKAEKLKMKPYFEINIELHVVIWWSWRGLLVDTTYPSDTRVGINGISYVLSANYVLDTVTVLARS